MAEGRPVRSGFHRLAATHACTSRTVPMTPDCSSSSVSRIPSFECPWLPICVATRVSFATRATRRASLMLCASGFSQ